MMKQLWNFFQTSSIRWQLVALSLHSRRIWGGNKKKLSYLPFTVSRKVFSCGDDGLRYRYSGSIKTASPWHEVLLPIREKIVQLTGQTYNFALLNYYSSGRDSLGFHSDDERDLLPNGIIASLSLGAMREFVFQKKKQTVQHNLNETRVQGGVDKKTVFLTEGSLLLMKGKTQKNFKHAVPKMPNVERPRINITFRMIVNSNPKEISKQKK